MEFRQIKESERQELIDGIQEAFQKGFEAYFGPTKETVIPLRDIEWSLNHKGAYAFGAFEDGKMLGGAVIVINEETQINALHILFTKVGVQNKGVGSFLWNSIEKEFPNTKKWTTCTPYFDQRNIHFYVNKCHFHIVEFINKYHNDGEKSEDFIGDHGEGMFEFEKVMK